MERDNKDNGKRIDRREFLKRFGGGAALTAAALAGCKTDDGTSDSEGNAEIVPGKMTYRTNPKTGEKVSILGYGCMRWPTVDNDSARDSDGEIDQEMVNRLVDYAIEHGVNYFDTSPVF